MKEFDRKAIEALEVKTIEAIEAITGPLAVNEELKATDEAGNLVTIIRTHTPEGKEQIQYTRRTTQGDGQEPVSFEVDIVSDGAAEEVE